MNKQLESKNLFGTAVIGETTTLASRLTATFHHTSGDVIDLVGTTSNHPFWSVERQEYVQAGSLRKDEHLRTIHGDTKRVISKLARPGPEPVYNLEVFGEHTYFVGKDGVLVHNNYIPQAPQSGPDKFYRAHLRSLSKKSAPKGEK